MEVLVQANRLKPGDVVLMGNISLVVNSIKSTDDGLQYMVTYSSAAVPAVYPYNKILTVVR